jgi:pimeloyl-ACP methyl ester carboxylesterase
MYFNSLYPTRKPADFAAYTAALKSNLTRPGRLEALHEMMLASKAASEERIHRVAVPTLVMMGSKDPDFKDPRVEAEWVAGQLKGNLQMVEGAGHYPHAEMPEITGPKIVAFIKLLQFEGSYAATASR